MMDTYTVRALTGLDAERVRIAAEKLGEYNRREGLTTATSLDGTWDIKQAATLATHLESMLEIIEHLTRPEPQPTKLDGCTCGTGGSHGAHCPWSMNQARRDWDAEAAEREQYADVLAADEADQRRADRAEPCGCWSALHLGHCIHHPTSTPTGLGWPA